MLMIIPEGYGVCVLGGNLPANFPNAKHNQLTQAAMSRNTSPSPQQMPRAMDGQSPETKRNELFIRRSSSDRLILLAKSKFLSLRKQPSKKEELNKLIKKEL